MVYNNVLYKPATLSERLQAKFGRRAANAVSKGSSDAKNTTERTAGQPASVLSFFGKIDDTKTADRAIPTKRRMNAGSMAAEPHAFKAQSAGVRRDNVRNARPGVHNNAVKNNAGVRGARPVAVNTQKSTAYDKTGTFARAYAAGERVRAASAKKASIPRRRYAEGAVPSGALRRGRSNIPGARHAVLVTADGAHDKRTFVEVIKDAFADRHVAEHRVKKSPFPIGLITLIGICAFMLMAMLFSFSQINECNTEINNLKAEQEALDAEAEKLEVQIAQREDIRGIERIAVEEIGMVSSDMVQSKFVSVSASDRVEVMRGDETETEEGGFSALLSVIGEYFN